MDSKVFLLLSCSSKARACGSPLAAGERRTATFCAKRTVRTCRSAGTRSSWWNDDFSPPGDEPSQDYFCKQLQQSAKYNAGY
jgi:hypothetical protein